MDQKTVYYEQHIQAGGKMVPFGGYILPVQYAGGILKEHKAVREGVGLFDVSHMGEILMEGTDALKNINHLVTNNCTGMADGQIRYSPMCYENGGTVDDLLVYKRGENKYLLVVNASNKDKDFEWITKNISGDVKATDVSKDTAQLALQGPLAVPMMKKLAKEEDIPAKYYYFTENVEVGGVPCLLSRTGYTGELGYEIYCDAKNAAALWDAVCAAGEEFSMEHCGLGCRDTLRLEASMCLYGHELSADITPKEAGVSFFIKMDKEEFIGKEALAAPAARKRIGLKLIDRGIAREGAPVYAGDKQVGHVTSGTSSPTLGCSIAMALVEAEAEGPFCVEVRGKKLAVEVVPMPFYKRG